LIREPLLYFRINFRVMFGVSTFCLHEVPLTDALDRISPLTRDIEIMDEGLHFLDSSEHLLSYSARYSIHAPCRGTNIASLLEPIRRASVEVIAQCFSIAAEVNASVVIHPGYFAWAEERTRAEHQLKKSLSALDRLSQEYSIRYFIENMGNWEYFLLKNPGELSLIEDTPFALDVGHAHQNHCLAGFLQVPAAHYHLHDNEGKEDSHLPLGKGTIDFKPVMAAVSKNKVIPILEVATFDGIIESIRMLDTYGTE